MRIKITDEQSSPPEDGVSLKADSIHISILLAVAFCVGIYLIGTTVLIAKDGITFIEYAGNFETSPVETMKREYQHPGYPFLIFIAHKITEITKYGSSMRSWIYSAQAAALVFRILTVVLLYFFGKKIVGKRFSFWAVLILILLPAPAEYGSDALSDWPHLFFLSAGFLLLIFAATSGKWWLFGFSGLAAGMGYLIRPECAQVVVFGSFWLGLQMFWSKRTLSKYKAAVAMALLLFGFLVATGPYMRLKGAIFPKKQLVQLPSNIEVCEQKLQISPNGAYTAGFAPSDIAGAFGKLVERISETLMWFFIPALLTGMYKHFRRRSWCEPEKFFIIAFIAFNVLIMTLLHCKFGYMSRRHTLPLVVMTIFYVPVGLEALASWLGEKFSGKTNSNFWFMVLVIVGIAICCPKLVRPIRAEKQSYREAARWLAGNTDEKDIIAAFDTRIGFYSGRKSIQYSGVILPKGAQYVVKVSEDEQNAPSSEEMLQMKEVFSIEGRGKESKVVIYKLQPQ
jgi:hypothetical protein